MENYEKYNKIINSIVPNDYTVAMHQINRNPIIFNSETNNPKYTYERNVSIANNILETGLNISNGFSPYYTIWVLGEYENVGFEQIYNYVYSPVKNTISIIMAFPKQIEIDNTTYYLGGLLEDIKYHSFQLNSSTIGGRNQHIYPELNSFPLDRLFTILHKIPIEFIVGYIVKGEKEKLVINPNFITLKSEEEQSIFYNQLFTAMQNLDIELSEFSPKGYFEYIQEKLQKNKILINDKQLRSITPFLLNKFLYGETAYEQSLADELNNIYSLKLSK